MTIPRMDQTVRDSIMADPAVVLDDKDVMRALVAANEAAMGGNVVDLRGIAMARLEARLDRLEDTHRSVIAAAYDNLAGTAQVHRAVLRLLDAPRFDGFLRDLGGDVAAILRVDAARLVLESAAAGGADLGRLGDVLAVEAPGFVDAYLGPRGQSRGAVLRQVAEGDGRLYGARGPDVRSEACLRLDLGPGRLPGMLALGAEDPHHFTPQQGTDLLGFFGGVFERAMRRWLD